MQSRIQAALSKDLRFSFFKFENFTCIKFKMTEGRKSEINIEQMVTEQMSNFVSARFLVLFRAAVVVGGVNKLVDENCALEVRLPACLLF